MGYDLRITRAERRDGSEPIDVEAWRGAVETTPDMRMIDRGTAAVWEPGPDGRSLTFELSDGEVLATYPDDVVIRKMIGLADRLGADVIGAEGEAYRLRNNVLVTVGEDGVVRSYARSAAAGVGPAKKPWWRFW